MILLLVPGYFLSFVSLPNLCIYWGTILALFYIKNFSVTLILYLPIMLGVIWFSEQYFKRIQGWLDPFAYRNEVGYEAVQSIYMVASGGLSGMGIGNGTAGYFLPDITSSHVLSAIAQQIGLYGVGLILLIYVFLFSCGVRAALHAQDSLGFYVALTVNIQLLLRVLMHAAVMLNLLPQTIIYLPFISYSGSAALLDFIYVGLLLNISRFKRAQVAGE